VRFFIYILFFLVIHLAGSDVTVLQGADPVQTLEYLSDTDPVYKYLENLQKSKTVIPPISFTPEGFCKRNFSFSTRPPSETSFRHCVEVLKRMPTRYESPFSHLLLTDLIDDIRKIQKKQLLKEPKFGTLPINSVNAEMLRIPGSQDPLIIIHSGLFNFVYEMTKLVLLTVDVKENLADHSIAVDFTEEAFRRSLRRYPDLPHRLMKIVGEFLGFGTYTPGLGPTEYDYLLAEMVGGMELFVIAHEIGHIMGDHKPVAEELDQNINAQRLLHSWNQEIEADTFGWHLATLVAMQHASAGPDNFDTAMAAYRMVAPVLFLRYAYIIDEVQSIAGTGSRLPPIDENEIAQLLQAESQGNMSPDIMKLKGLNTSHPPALFRRKTLALVTQQSAPSKLANPNLRQYIDLGLALDRNMNALFNQVGKGLRRDRD
jgi:hypothetical protein